MLAWDPAPLSQPFSSAPVAAVYNIDESLPEEEKRRIRIEASRYLGGDDKHTHFVRGLDYALLKVVREKMAKQEEEEKAKQVSSGFGNSCCECQTWTGRVWVVRPAV